MSDSHRPFGHEITRIAGLTLLCWGIVTEAQDTSSIHDIERVETYGNCSVFDEVDMLTDAVTHNLQCREATITDETVLLFFVRDGGDFAVAVSKGAMFHLADSIAVAIRVDRGELRTGDWSYGQNYAFVFGDADLFTSLLTEVSNGERVAMQVGNESGNIRLGESDGAVRDFLLRIDTIQLNGQ